MASTQTTDDANVFYDRSLGTITNGTNGHPNQLVQATPFTGTTTPADQVSASYDAAGDLALLTVQRSPASCGTPGQSCTSVYQYDWDEVGRLARGRRYDFTGPGAQPLSNAAPAVDVRYAYDANGQRVLRAELDAPSSKKASPPGTTYTAEVFSSLRVNDADFDATANDYERTAMTEAVYLESAGTSLGRVVYGAATLPSASGGQQHVFLEVGDELGSQSIAIDKDTGELVERSTYQAYGADESEYAPDRWGDFKESYRFTGKERDAAIGMTYFGARYYNAQLGRWASADPLTVHALGNDMNPYNYVRGQVFSAFDALGLDPVWIGGTQQTQQTANELTISVTEDYADSASQPQGPQLPDETLIDEVHQSPGDAALERGMSASVLADLYTPGGPAGPIVLRALATQAPSTASINAANPLYGALVAEVEKGAALNAAGQGNIRLAAKHMAVAVEASASGARNLINLILPVLAVESSVASTAETVAIRGPASGAAPVSPPGAGQIVRGSLAMPVFEGHGRTLPGIGATTPAGTWLAVPETHLLSEDAGRSAAMNGRFPADVPFRIFGPGDRLPNLVLGPATPGMEIRPTSWQVTRPTLLADIIEANMGYCIWAACR